MDRKPGERAVGALEARLEEVVRKCNPQGVRVLGVLEARWRKRPRVPFHALYNKSEDRKGACLMA